MDTDLKTSISEQGSEVQTTETKIVGNKYELEIALENKMYPKTYYSHQSGSVTLDEIPTKFKALELQIAKWTLIEDQQLMNLNLGTDAEPQMVKINA